MKALLCVSLCLAACADDVIDDPIDQVVVSDDGKADAYGIVDGSPEALGILQLASTMRYSDLRPEVGLGPKAVSAIYDHRREPGDRFYDAFDTLKELDQVKYVGKTVFEKLLAYAEDNGYVTPDAFITPCTGPTISLARLQQLTVNGTKNLPTGATWIRSRECNGVLGCGPWSAATKLGIPANSRAGAGASGALLTGKVAFAHTLRHYEGAGYLDEETRYDWSFSIKPGTPSTLTGLYGTFSYWYGNVTTYTDLQDETVTFTDHCVKAYGRIPASAPGKREIEVSYLGLLD